VSTQADRAKLRPIPARGKRIAAIAGGVTTLLIAAALLAPSVIDWSRYKDRIAGMAASATGREVTIGGDVDFTLLPSPAFRAADVRIANLPDGRADALARLAHLDVVVELLPLLRGDLQVRRIVLDRPEIALERLPDGQVNWRFPDFEDSERGAQRIGLERVEIRAGRLGYSDLATGRSFAADGITLRLSAPTLAGPLRLSGAAALAGVSSEFELRTGRIEDTAQLPLHLRIETAGASLRYTGRLNPQADTRWPASAGEISVEGTALGRLIVALARATGGAATDTRAAERWAGAFAIDGRLETGAQFRLSELNASFAGSRVRGEIAVTPGERPATDITLAADSVDLDRLFGEHGGTLDIARLLDHAPELPGELTLAVGVDAIKLREEIVSGVTLVATGEDGIFRLEELAARLPGATDLRLSGRIEAADGRPELQGRLTGRTGNLRRVLDWLGHSPPGRAGRYGVAAIETSIRADSSSLALEELQLQLDATEAAGRTSLARGPGGPRLEADLALDRLDLDRYLPTPPDDAAPLTPAGMERWLAATMDELAPLTARAAVTLDRLDLAGQAMRAVTLRAAFEEDALTIEDARVGDIAGASGHIAGRLARPGQPTGDGTLEADLLLRAEIPDPDPLTRWIGIDLAGASDALAPVGLDGRITGGLGGIRLDLGGSLAGGRVTLSGEIADPAGERPGPIELEFTFDHPSHRALAERFALHELSRGSALPLHVAAQVAGDADSLKLALESELLGGGLRFEGSMLQADTSGRSLSGVLQADHPEAQGLLRQLYPGYAPRADSLGPVALRAGIDAAEGRLAFEPFDAEIGPAAFAGRIVLAEGAASRPHIEAELAAGELAVDAFLPPAETGPHIAKAGEGRRWSTRPFDLTLLGEIDGSLALRSKAIVVAPYRLEEAALAGTLADGTLTLERLDGLLFGGETTASARLAIGAGRPELAGEISIAEADLEPALEAVAALRPATGRFSLAGRFETRGNSRFAMASSLDGEAELTIRNGSLRGIDLPRLATAIAELETADGAEETIAGALGSGETLLERLEADITMRNGRLVSRDMRAQLGSGLLRLDSEIDLAAWSVSASGRLALAGYPTAPPIPLEIGGSLAAPRIAFEPRGIRLWLTRRLAVPSFVPIPLSDAASDGPLGAPEVVGPDTPDRDEGRKAKPESGETSGAEPARSARTDGGERG